MLTFVATSGEPAGSGPIIHRHLGRGLHGFVRRPGRALSAGYTSSPHHGCRITAIALALSSSLSWSC